MSILLREPVRNAWTLLACGLWLASGACALAGETYYVSPAGNDRWSGRLAEANAAGTDGPWKTLGKACESLQAGDMCRLRGGVYRETLRPRRNGTAAAPIVFQAQPGETATISGADPIEGWEASGDRLHQANMSWDLEDENQVFAGDQMLTEARWPNNQGGLLTPTRAEVEGGSASTITDSHLPGNDGLWNGAILWCAGGHRWYCWSATVTAFDSSTKTLSFDKPQPNKWYTPRKGNEYVLMGARAALDAEGEWWFDRDNKELWLIPPAGQDPDTVGIEAKRRKYVIDLSASSFIQILGIHFRAGGIQTDGDSHHLVFRDLHGQYIGHSYSRDVSTSGTVLISGHDNEMINCELEYASGSLVRLEGHDNRLVNCFVHDGNYAGKWRGVAAFSGRRQLISHNTIRDSGRDVCSVHGLMESIVQYNELSHAGWLTSDLGMTYGHNTDFMGTVFRYNLVHDNLAKGHTAGIYFDHCSHNAIVHHNIVWNVPGMPLQVNNPAYFMLCYNNTLWNGGRISTFDHSHRNDMFGCRFQNNICPARLQLPEHVVTQPNLISANPGFLDPAEGRFELRSDSPARGSGIPLPGISRENGQPDLGALQVGWRAGHDFQNPPQVDTSVAEIAFSNALKNSAFELGSTEFWTLSGDGLSEIVTGNGWGNGFGQSEAVKTGTSKYELKLTGPCELQQVVTGLRAGTQYQASAWIKLADQNMSAVFGIRLPNREEVTVTVRNTTWERALVAFALPRQASEVVLFVRQPAGGTAFVDNLGLPRNIK